MLKKIGIIAVIGIFASVSLFAQKNGKLSVLSFNIRYNNPDDGINAWPHRIALATSAFTDNNVDIAGLQEALYGQVKDLVNAMPQYAFIGVGRDDGKRKGELSPILYNRKKFQLLASNTFWLSKTPDVIASKDWDAAITRICTWAKFRDKENDTVFYFFNTHFDHRGEQSRVESARLILKKIAEISEGKPFILTGDFNVPPASEPIQTIVNSVRPAINDARKVSEQIHFGNNQSFNGWGKSKSTEPIDYIFVKEGIKVLKHGYLLIKKGGVYISDHYPVLSVITFD